MNVALSKGEASQQLVPPSAVFVDGGQQYMATGHRDNLRSGSDKSVDGVGLIGKIRSVNQKHSPITVGQVSPGK